MDEPCSALDPIATRRIEELMVELKENYTIAIVTHNMQQAQRVADITAFFSSTSPRAAAPATWWSPAHQADLREPARAAHQGVRLRRVQLTRMRTASRAESPCAAGRRSALAERRRRSRRREDRRKARIAPARRRRDVPGAALREVDPGLPARAPGRRHHATTRSAAAKAAPLPGRCRGLRRQRCRAERRADGQREVRRPAGAGHRRHRRARLQPPRAGRAAQAQPRRLRGHLRRPHPHVERPPDPRGQPRPRTCRTAPSLSWRGRTAAARPSRSPIT